MDAEEFMKDWDKHLILLLCTIGMSSAELLMRWVIQEPLEWTLFAGFMARLSLVQIFSNKYSYSTISLFRVFTAAGSWLLPQGFAILSPNPLTITLCLALNFNGFIMVDDLQTWYTRADRLLSWIDRIKLKLLVDHNNGLNDRREQRIRTRVAELSEDVAPKIEERRRLKDELEAIEQKKGYRGSR